MAVEHKVNSVAFPAISTGVYGYPLIEATKVAIGAVQASLRGYPTDDKDWPLTKVVFCCFSQTDAEVYTHLLQAD